MWLLAFSNCGPYSLSFSPLTVGNFDVAPFDQRGPFLDGQFQSPDGGEFRCGLNDGGHEPGVHAFQSPDGGEFRCGRRWRRSRHSCPSVSVP